MTPELEALERLKPCPFCGSENLEVSAANTVVECNGCQTTGPFDSADQNPNIDAWNKRADSKPLPWLRAEEVKEEGFYWWRPKPYREKAVVRVSKLRGVLHYERANYYYLMPSLEEGGIWQRIPEPEMPEEEKP